MSETTDTKFEIEIDDETTLRRDDLIEHAKHGPMRVDSIRVGHAHKTAELKSELGPIGLDLTDEELRDQWGETIAQDPFEVHEPGSAQFRSSGISAEGCDIEVDLTVSGPEDNAEKVQMHAIDQIVRGMQAVRDEQPPSECDGAEYSINWESVFEDDD